jgi:hypothetical protein
VPSALHPLHVRETYRDWILGGLFMILMKQANLALTSQRYTEEHDRCTRYETMWRDAQDREAKGQFEIAQLLDELAQARAKR